MSRSPPRCGWRHSAAPRPCPSANDFFLLPPLTALRTAAAPRAARCARASAAPFQREGRLAFSPYTTQQPSFPNAGKRAVTKRRPVHFHYPQTGRSHSSQWRVTMSVPESECVRARCSFPLGAKDAEHACEAGLLADGARTECASHPCAPSHHRGDGSDVAAPDFFRQAYARRQGCVFRLQWRVRIGIAPISHTESPNVEEYVAPHRVRSSVVQGSSGCV